MLVRIIQNNSKDGVVTEEVAWEIMVFLPKGRGEYWEIGLVEMVWKVFATVVNCRLKRSVTLRDALHAFRAGWGTSTSTLEENLAQQLARIANKPLFQVFLDVRKAYDSLDRGRCMEILQGHRTGRNTAHLIDHHWNNLTFDQK